MCVLIWLFRAKNIIAPKPSGGEEERHLLSTLTSEDDDVSYINISINNMSHILNHSTKKMFQVVQTQKCIL